MISTKGQLSTMQMFSIFLGCKWKKQSLKPPHRKAWCLKCGEIWWCVCMPDVLGKKDHVPIASVVREIRYGFQLRVSTKDITITVQTFAKACWRFQCSGPQTGCFRKRAGFQLLTHRQIVLTHHNQHWLKLTRRGPPLYNSIYFKGRSWQPKRPSWSSRSFSQRNHWRNRGRDKSTWRPFCLFQGFFLLF